MPLTLICTVVVVSTTFAKVRFVSVQIAYLFFAYLLSIYLLLLISIQHIVSWLLNFHLVYNIGSNFIMLDA